MPCRILFLASNPQTTSPLDLAEELRGLEHELRAIEFRKDVTLIARHAVRPDDLVRLLSANAHASKILEKLVAGERVKRLEDVRDRLEFPKVRLCYDGIVVERDQRTPLHCELAMWNGEL
jgi:hypothetical protein